MKYFLILSVLYISLANSIIGKKASDQFFPKIMNWLKLQEQKIDQTLAFQALSQIIKETEQELQQNNENKDFVNQLQQQIQDVCHQKKLFEFNLNNDEENFLNEELIRSLSYFQNTIKDKEKMIEQDNREIEKLKKQIKDHSKLQLKLKEVQELIKEIEQSLQNGTADKLYKTLEIIESKAILGLFQPQSQYEEVELFLKNVDQLFKNKDFKQDQFEIVNLLSMIKNVLQDMNFNILIKIQDDDITYYEMMQFFENAKSTHIFALDYFKNESQQFLGTLIQLWKNQWQIQPQIYKDVSYFCQIMEQYLLDYEKHVLETQNEISAVKHSLKKMETDFIKKNQNSK